ncbi:uncharacterized protein [Pagrus major]|uniref:uncharacterized protein n=1 Tax=Pagrus major TaxID=143350 RepID=UPI003CC88D9C
MDREEPEPPHIKEEEEELWTSQEGEQLRGPEEADITEFTFTVKSEEDEEKPQSSQLHQRQTEQMKTEADGEDCGGPEPAWDSDPDRHLRPDTDNNKTDDFSEPETDDSDDWKDKREPQTGSNSKKKNKVDLSCKTDEKTFSCSECGERFGRKYNLTRHMRTHTGEKPFTCPVCRKSFTQGGGLKEHMAKHTGEKRFSCSVCDRRFTWQFQLKRHKCGGESSQPHELWTSQEGEQLPGLDEAEIIKFTFTPVTVKSEEDDEEKPQSSQLHQRQTEQIETEADGEDCGGPEPDRNPGSDRHLHPDSDDKTEDSSEAGSDDNDDDWKETKEPQTGFNCLKMNKVPVSEAGCDADNKPSSCSECGKGYNQKSKPNMRNHTGEKPFSCSVCSKKFTRKAGLDTHLKTHTGEKPYSCPLCKKCFSLSAHLRLHIRTHTGEKPFSCNICNKRFTWPTQLKRHKCDESSQLHDLSTNQEGERLEGTFTAVPLKSKEEEEELQSSRLHERQTELMKKEADGEDCGRPEPDGDAEHPSEPETDHIGDRKETRKPHTCSNSHKENVLVNDIECNTEEKPVGCSECGAKPFKCPVCGAGLSRKTNLIRHMTCHTGEKPYSCSVCEKSFRYRGSVMRHMKIHTMDKSFRIRKSVSCSECGKSYNRKEHLVLHMRTHTGEKPYSCSVCNKSFTQSKYLKSHMRTHTGEKPFGCSVCGKSFGQKEHLQFHLKGHSGERPYSCSHCNKRFFRSRDLRRHSMTHTGEKPYSCSVCDKRFTWLYQFKRHTCGDETSQLNQLSTNQEGEQLQRGEEADIIKFTFTPDTVKSEDDEEKSQSSQLHHRQTEQMKTEADGQDCGGPEPARNSDPDQHLHPDSDNKNTGDFSEPESDDSGDWRDNKDKNGDQTGSTSQKKNKGDLRRKADEKTFSCSECGERFGRKYNLTRHVRTHTGEKPFTCPVCRKSFTQGGGLKEHMVTHTGEKRFSCSACDKRFIWHYQLKRHKCDGGESSQPHGGNSDSVNIC